VKCSCGDVQTKGTNINSAGWADFAVRKLIADQLDLAFGKVTGPILGASPNMAAIPSQFAS
jgi:hypothetical protein